MIDEEKFIALLVDATGRPREAVIDELDELKARISETVNTADSFEIPHFGKFFAKEGQLKFEPDERLATEINQKYAGMEPLELMAAVREGGAGVPVEGEADEVEETERPAAEETEEIIQEPVTPAESVSAEEDIETPREKEEKKIVTPVAAKAEIKKTKRKTKRKSAKKVPPIMQERNGHPFAKVAAVLFVIAILAAGGWFLYQSDLTQRFTTAGIKEAVPDSAGRAQTKRAMAASPDSAKNQNVRRDTMEQNAENSVSTQQQAVRATDADSRYGLKGSVNKKIQSAYTIVVHSFRLKSTVREIADSLDQRGFRTVLFSGTAGDVTRWRLGLGQFRTVDAAQEAARTLSEPYHTNHFIKRFNQK